MLNMDFKVAQYALLMVRYRSAEAAIAFITQPEFGLYRHEFIGYVPRHAVHDNELGEQRALCLLCQDRDSAHGVSMAAIPAPDDSALAKELNFLEVEEPLNEN